jgi:hypothetical protein
MSHLSMAVAIICLFEATQEFAQGNEITAWLMVFTSVWNASGSLFCLQEARK